MVAGYVREMKPVLIGVDGGADALVEAGKRPNIIVGDDGQRERPCPEVRRGGDRARLCRRPSPAARPRARGAPRPLRAKWYPFLARARTWRCCWPTKRARS